MQMSYRARFLKNVVRCLSISSLLLVPPISSAALFNFVEVSSSGGMFFSDSAQDPTFAEQSLYMSGTVSGGGPAGTFPYGSASAWGIAGYGVQSAYLRADASTGGFGSSVITQNWMDGFSVVSNYLPYGTPVAFSALLVSHAEFSGFPSWTGALIESRIVVSGDTPYPGSLSMTHGFSGTGGYGKTSTLYFSVESFVGGHFNLEGYSTFSGEASSLWDGESFERVGLELNALNTVRFTLSPVTYGAEFVSSSGTAYTISPIPEPQTYALMLAGLGLLGFRIRRKARL